ncbi:MAG TPA: IPT/TIG domain-containing protein, partial [Pyrinomonadaceae bacterium]|nr:IPT/TIG domain-containing protein [Pyrinomonadaceae bacterium]
NVTVTNPGGESGTKTNGFTYAAAPLPAPSVSGINPTSGTTAGGTSVTISGSNFVSGATVTIGSTAATNVVVTNSTTITATTPAHTAGTVNVTVQNPDAQSGTLVSGYTYTTPGETVLLVDDFNDSAIDGSKWISNNLFSGFTDPSVALQETTQFRIGPLKQNVDGSHYNGIKSANAFNFTGGYSYVQIVQAPAATTLANAFFTLGLNVDNCYRMYLEGPNLVVQSKLGAAKVTLLQVAFNPTNHAFWRMRHDAVSGQIVFEVAPANGSLPGAWSILASAAWNTSAVPLTSVSFELKGGTWRTEANNPGTVVFDNFKAARP